MDDTKVFEKISEGNKISIQSIETSGEYSVDIVEYTGNKKPEEKIIAFDVVESHNPRIVMKYDKVYLEINLPDHPEGWTEYIPVDNLEIID